MYTWFYSCQSVQRRLIHKEAAPVCKQIGDALGEVAPSVLLTSLTEAMAFFLLGILLVLNGGCTDVYI